MNDFLYGPSRVAYSYVTQREWDYYESEGYDMSFYKVKENANV